MVYLNHAEAVAQALPAWDPKKHPRGRDGKFIETGAFVQVFSGPDGPQIASGRVSASFFAPDGRIFIGVDVGGGKTEWYRPKQIQTVNPKGWLKDGKEPVDADSGVVPDAPIPSVDEKHDMITWDEGPIGHHYDPDLYEAPFHDLLDSGQTEGTPPSFADPMANWDPHTTNWDWWISENGLPADSTYVAVDLGTKAIYTSSDNGVTKWSLNPDGSSSIIATHVVSADDFVDGYMDGDLLLVHGPADDQSIINPNEDVDPLWPPSNWGKWLTDEGFDHGAMPDVYVNAEQQSDVYIVNPDGSASFYQDGHAIEHEALSAEDLQAMIADGTLELAYTEHPKDPPPSLQDWEQQLLGQPAAPSDGGYLAPPGVTLEPGDKIYSHPQGSTIVVHPDGIVIKVGPDGKKKATSATAAKLSAGHGQWMFDGEVDSDGKTLISEDGDLLNIVDESSLVPDSPPDGPVVAPADVPTKWQDEEGIYMYPPEGVLDAVKYAAPGAKIYKRYLVNEWAVAYSDGSVSRFDENGYSVPNYGNMTPEMLDNPGFQWSQLYPALEPEDFGPVSSPTGLMANFDPETDQVYYSHSNNEWIVYDANDAKVRGYWSGGAIQPTGLAPSIDTVMNQSYDSGYTPVYPIADGVFEAASPDGEIPGYTPAPGFVMKGDVASVAKDGHDFYSAPDKGWVVVNSAGQAFKYDQSGKHTATLGDFSDIASTLDTIGYIKVVPSAADPNIMVEEDGEDPPSTAAEPAFEQPPIPDNLAMYAKGGQLQFNTKTGDWAVGSDNGSVHHYYGNGQFKSTAGHSGAIEQFENPEWVPVDLGTWGEKPAPQKLGFEPPIPDGMTQAAGNGQVYFNPANGQWILVPGKESGGGAYYYHASGAFKDTGNITAPDPSWIQVDPGTWGQEPAAPSAPAPSGPAYAPIKLPAGKTAGDLIQMISTSYENKGLAADPHNMTSSQFAMQLDQFVLGEKDYDAALKKLNELMTMAKLGGKQRARYKTLLMMHLGHQPHPGESDKSAIIGDPGHWRPIEPTKVAGSIGAVKGNQLVQSGGPDAGRAKANIQRALAKRLEGRVTLEQMVNSILDTDYMSGSDVKMLANKALEAKQSGKPLSGALVKGSNGNWGYSSYATPGPGMMAPTPENFEKALRETVASTLVQLWAQTSNDHNVRSLAMQKAAEDEFGLKGTYQWAQMAADTQKEYDKHGALFRDFLRCMYENTQEWAKANGVSHIRLVRGMSGTANSNHAGVGQHHKLQLRPMSSFSSNVGTATNFGSSYVVEAYVPIEWIIGTAATGFGCRNEYEWVILGGVHNVRRLK